MDFSKPRVRSTPTSPSSVRVESEEEEGSASNTSQTLQPVVVGGRSASAASVLTEELPMPNPGQEYSDASSRPEEAAPDVAEVNEEASAAPPRRRTQSTKARPMSTRQKKPLGERVVKSRNHEYCVEQGFKSNFIRTNHYSLLNFFPKNLFEQFTRIANFYFLLIAILQFIPGLSAITPATSVMPLVVVISATAIREAAEDYRRRKQDKEINNRSVRLIEGTSVEKRLSLDLQVGDLVRIEKGDNVPADVVALSTSGDEGMSFVDTAQLDGETNLKARQCRSATMQLGDLDELEKVDLVVRCDVPNNRLYDFNGALEIRPRGSTSDVKAIPLTNDQVLLRGHVLRNTQWVVGIVVYTGHETKLMMNAIGAKTKHSSLEKMMNRVIITMFIMLFVCCFIGAVVGFVYAETKQDDMWFLAPFDLSGAFTTAGLTFLRTLINMSTFVPISLYVSIEMVKLVHMYYINHDLKMYDGESETWAKARTSNLSEELGQIHYVFSDKTGTLTQNVMEFLKCSIAGTIYGSGTTEIGRAAVLRRQGKSIVDMFANTKFPEEEDEHGSTASRRTSRSKTKIFKKIEAKRKGFNFDDDRIVNAAWKSQSTDAEIKMFYTCLAVCNGVLPEADDTDADGLAYQATSPDELALVEGARGSGFVLLRRTAETVTMGIKDGDSMEEETFTVLNVMEFDSNRKRMSVIVRTPDDRIRLFCKGADTVIIPRLSTASTYVDQTIEHMEIFADEGLRTLACAYTDLNRATYEEWNERYQEAAVSTENRAEKLADLAEEIERELHLVGATGIEDKLQVGVPRTIHNLARAGVRIWVLTGDKQETVINIGFACMLITNDMNLEIMNGRTTEEVREQLGAIESLLDEDAQSGVLDSTALVIDNEALRLVLQPQLRDRFFRASTRCKAVLCCRVSPLQKAQVVKLVREKKGTVTLAIGDGANDVSMIQAAHVGIGISGKEGMQAVLASDYAIAQFRYLERLLLVHGRWNYLRIALLVTYSFYKNIFAALTQFWFLLTSGGSGATLIDGWFIGLYNVFFTSLPILVFASFEQDISDKLSIAYPLSYAPGQTSRFFNANVFVRWILEGFVGSFLVFGIAMFAFGDASVLPNGQMINGVWSIGAVVYTCVITIVNLRLALETRYWTWLNHFSYWGSIVFWLVFSIIYTELPFTLLNGLSATNVMHVAVNYLTSPAFYFVLMATIVITLFPAMFLKYWSMYTDDLPEAERTRLEVARKGHDYVLQQASVYMQIDAANKEAAARLRRDTRSSAGSGPQRSPAPQPTFAQISEENLAAAPPSSGLPPRPAPPHTQTDVEEFVGAGEASTSAGARPQTSTSDTGEATAAAACGPGGARHTRFRSFDEALEAPHSFERRQDGSRLGRRHLKTSASLHASIRGFAFSETPGMTAARMRGKSSINALLALQESEHVDDDEDENSDGCP